MTWLVTGGAGYIGAHIVRALREAGLDPVVIDDLSSGHAAFVPEGVPFVEASILDAAAVEATIIDHGVTGVIHVAGFKYAGVSVERPLHTYEQNVFGMITLLEAMQKHGVDKCVFSSSAAVYGAVDVDLVTEETPKNPASPYGESKLIGEWLLADQEVAAGLHHTSLRYFNVVGSGDPALRDTSPQTSSPSSSTRSRRGARRASTATTTRPPTARACATTCTSPTSPSRTSPPRVASKPASRSSRPTTWVAVTASRCARSWMLWPTSPASPSTPRWRPAAPATRRASWRAASSRRATSAGRCATLSPRWWPARGTLAAHPLRAFCGASQPCIPGRTFYHPAT